MPILRDSPIILERPPKDINPDDYQGKFRPNVSCSRWDNALTLHAGEIIFVNDDEFPDGMDVKKEIKDLKEAYRILSDKIQEISDRLTNLEYHPSIIGPIVNERCQARLEGKEPPHLPGFIGDSELEE